MKDRDMTRQTFYKRLRSEGYKMERDGFNTCFSKDFDGDHTVVLFIRKDYNGRDYVKLAHWTIPFQCNTSCWGDGLWCYFDKALELVDMVNYFSRSLK